MSKTIEKGMVTVNCDGAGCCDAIDEGCRYFGGTLAENLDGYGWQHIDGRDLCPACAEKEGK